MECPSWPPRQQRHVLENFQLEPDVKVANKPDEVVRGIDAQIETAVRTLLNDIDGK